MRIEKDLASGEVEQTLAENMKLASALGISGTPGYVVGKDVIVGAIGLLGLEQHINTAESSTN